MLGLLCFWLRNTSSSNTFHLSLNPGHLGFSLFLGHTTHSQVLTFAPAIPLPAMPTLTPSLSVEIQIQSTLALTLSTCRACRNLLHLLVSQISHMSNEPNISNPELLCIKYNYVKRLQ